MRPGPETVIEHRRFVLAGIGLLTLLFGCLALRMNLDRNPEEMLFQGDPNYPLLKGFMQEFGYDEIVVAVYTSDDVLAEEQVRALAAVTDALLALDGVDRVVSLASAVDVAAGADGSLEVRPLLRRGAPLTRGETESLVARVEQNPHYQGLLLSGDRRAALFDVSLEDGLDLEARAAVLEGIERAFEEHGAPGDGVLLSGAPVGRQEMFRCVHRDTALLFPLTLLLLVAGLFFFFRNLLQAVLPLAVTSLCVLWAVGAMSALGYPFNLLSVIVPSVLVIIGSSDCIHIMSRFDEGLRGGARPAEAALGTLRDMALPCLLTTVTTIVGFLSLLLSPLASIRQFGTANAVGIAFTYAVSMLLLPLALGRFRRNGGGPPRGGSASPDRLGALLRALLRAASAHRAAVLAASGGAVLAGLYGVSGLHVETDLPRFFASDSRGVAEARRIEETFGGILPVHVIVDSGQPGGLADPALLREIDRLCSFLRRLEGVDKVLAVTDLLKLANRRLHGDDPAAERLPETRQEAAQLLLTLEMADPDGLLARFSDAGQAVASVGIRFARTDFYSIRALEEAVSAYLAPRLETFPGASHHVTGTSVLCTNTLLPLLAGLKTSLFLALGAILVIMVLLFRSVSLGVLSMIPNVLPIALTLGTMGLCGIALNIVTAPVAAVALGLAVDDTIHFLTAFRREFARDRRYGPSLERTLDRTGKPILVTSAVLAAGFGALLLSDFQPTRNFGLLVSLTVGYAVFADLVLLPVLLLVFKPLGREREEAVAEEAPATAGLPVACLSSSAARVRMPGEEGGAPCRRTGSRSPGT